MSDLDRIWSRAKARRDWEKNGLSPRRRVQWLAAREQEKAAEAEKPVHRPAVTLAEILGMR